MVALSAIRKGELKPGNYTLSAGDAQALAEELGVNARNLVGAEAKVNQQAPVSSWTITNTVVNGLSVIGTTIMVAITLRYARR
ncbi:hypothetical protein EV356DRAFT_535963 [Viridothelium virens]|uniref:Uncharacterized protein n=1 Tax=Viridothelium virens TaxID=1048519 RepID=A0A6A6GYK3_VIRVR|nr:hypothetical protein EV356DRAFT_535963 [Viridothelium virens]